MNQPVKLDRLLPGMLVMVSSDTAAVVDEELAGAFEPGDRLLAAPETGELLRVPAGVSQITAEAVEAAAAAFQELSNVEDEQIDRFYEIFAARLEDESCWAEIRRANEDDLEAARSRGRSVTRLVASDRMRADMAAGLRAWAATEPVRGKRIETIEHPGWRVEQVAAPLGVVAFVFEARPNVFADATGVLRGGNSVVFRIGGDAYRTAVALMQHALRPSLAAAGLPEGSVSLVRSTERSAGWALFSDRRISLAVARGSGAAVAMLGGIARQNGIPVSLHGTGGAWMVADESARPDRLRAAMEASLDRKVCNTLNVLCLPRSRAHDLVPAALAALEAAGEARGSGCKLHIARGDEAWLPPGWLDREVLLRRAGGDVRELRAEPIAVEDLGTEWEWEESPEISLKMTEDMHEAIALFNRYSPHFVGSLISEDPAAHEEFYRRLDAPFTGNGFTRWVDGQYALNRPELGLSNWQHGRLLARGAVLSGDSVFTIRTRAMQSDPSLRR